MNGMYATWHLQVVDFVPIGHAKGGSVEFIQSISLHAEPCMSLLSQPWSQPGRVHVSKRSFRRQLHHTKLFYENITRPVCAGGHRG